MFFYFRDFFGCGVRPAAHLSLQSLADTASSGGYKISASLASGAHDRALLDISSSIYAPDSGEDHIFTYTPKSNYFINSITIGATDGSFAQTAVTIEASVPSSYSTLGSSVCTYKVYRSGETVKVIVNQVTVPITIVGDAAATLNLTSGSYISNAKWVRENCSTTTATVSATFGSGRYPQVSYNSGTSIKISSTAGSGGLGGVISYNYTFVNNAFSITFSGLPTGYSNIPKISLSTYTLGSYTVTVNVSNAVYEVATENEKIVVNVTPDSNYYITQAYTNSNEAEDIKYYNGYLLATDSAFAISYIASDSTSRVSFVIYNLTGNLTLNLVTNNTKPILKLNDGKIDGVACIATSGGEARMVGFSADDTGITFIAVAYAGYQFDGWFIQGEETALSTEISCILEKSIIDGRVIIARFSVISPDITEKTNTDTETDDNGGFV